MTVFERTAARRAIAAAASSVATKRSLVGTLEALARLGFAVSHRVTGELLHHLGYSL